MDTQNTSYAWNSTNLYNTDNIIQNIADKNENEIVTMLSISAIHEHSEYHMIGNILLCLLYQFMNINTEYFICLLVLTCWVGANVLITFNQFIDALFQLAPTCW